VPGRPAWRQAGTVGPGTGTVGTAGWRVGGTGREVRNAERARRPVGVACVGADRLAGGGGAVLQEAGQQLDRDQRRESGPAGDDPAYSAVVGGGDVGGQAGGGADGQGGPGQPPGSAASAAVGEQNQGRDDLDPNHREGERMGVPASVAVRGGELAHMAVGDGAGDPG